MSTLIPLENVRVATPCRAEWNLMEGDERVRFCQSCAKNVYNLSDMGKADAQQLIQEKEGNLCVRYYQRADGTVISADCPVGVKIVRRPFQWLAASFVALLASGAAIATQGAGAGAPVQEQRPTFNVREIPLLGTLIDRIEGRESVTMGAPGPIMGEMMCPQPAPPPTSAPKPKE